MARRDLALFAAPEPVRQRPTGNEVALRGDSGAKVHRAKWEDQRVRAGQRRTLSTRDRDVCDGDSRLTRCGWTVFNVRHTLVAAVDPADLCRLCWPGGAPAVARPAPTLLENP